MNIGILSQSKERNITGINRVTIGTMTELLRLDSDNKYSFIGDTEWLNLDMATIPAMIHTDEVNNLSFTCKAYDLNVVHSHFRPFHVNAHIPCGKVLTIHDLIALRYPDWYKSQNYFFDEALRKSAREADVIVAVSEATKKDVVEIYKIPEEKVKVVYSGLFPNNLFVAEKGGEKVETLNERPFLLSVSGIGPHKNQQGLAEAFVLYKQRYPDSDLQLVITGPVRRFHVIREIMERHPEASKDIVFTGFVTDAELLWLYQNAEAFVYVSFVEGFGLPILEAMSVGKAIITSDVSSMAEVGGDAVEYCNPFEIETIVNAIEKVCHDKCHKRMLEERAVVRAKRFSYENTAREILEIYKNFEL